MSKKVTWSFKRDDVTHNEEGTFRTTVDIPTNIETQTVANGTNDGNGKINQQEVDNGIGKTHHSERGVSDTKETPVEADKSAAGDTNATTVPQKVNEGSGKQHHSETGTSDTKKTLLAADKNVAEELRSSGERHANLTTEPQEFDNGNGKTQQSETGISSIKKTSGEANENASEGIVVMIPNGTQTGGMQAVTKEPETSSKAVTRVGIRDIILRELNAPLHA
ncbi:hypothetical protein BaRGS_00027285 [Batillaria attramentaria]|uniref:Hypervirulence associated protein TUDOR domain-containing protein n=1 Tax=Batillaria attramentaria TaxID=370345 RepID=A0ABD0K2I0_9CAEN